MYPVDEYLQAPTMNAVEIEAAVSELASAKYDGAEFPFQFLAAFDKKETTLKRLRKGDSNMSEIPGAVLLINNIHLATCLGGQTRETLERPKASPKTASAQLRIGCPLLRTLLAFGWALRIMWG